MAHTQLNWYKHIKKKNQQTNKQLAHFQWLNLDQTIYESRYIDCPELKTKNQLAI